MTSVARASEALDKRFAFEARGEKIASHLRPVTEGGVGSPAELNMCV